MNLRILMILSCICIAMLFCGCSKENQGIKSDHYNKSTLNEDIKQEEELKSNELSKLSKDEKIEIGKSLFDKYINDNRTDWKIVKAQGLNRKPVVSLTDYKIKEIDFIKEKDDTFTLDVSYDIKIPNEEDGRMWIAGNGESGEDNWVVNKCNFIDIKKVDDKYTITNMYTG